MTVKLLNREQYREVRRWLKLELIRAKQSRKDLECIGGYINMDICKRLELRIDYIERLLEDLPL